MCGEVEESGSHVFFKCKVAWRVWCLCSKWIREIMVYHWDSISHFLQFKLGWATQKINNIWENVWIVVVGEI